MITLGRFLCAAVTGWAAVSALAASGAGSDGLPPALSLLPEVEFWETDADGHLVRLEGRLTPEGAAPPARVAATFMEVHRELFGAARNSRFHAESSFESDGESTVMVRQSVDGFASALGRIEMTFIGRILTLVTGPVLDDREVPPTEDGRLVTESKAIETARVLLGPTMVEKSTTVQAIIEGASPRRCWRVETVAGSSAGDVLQAVLIDALSGQVLSHRVTSLPRGAGRGPGDFRSGSPVAGCIPVTPPVGEFSTPGGQSLWHGAEAGCGRWEFDPGRSASLFHGDCLEYECSPYPSTDHCDHGEVTREGLELGAGLERVKLRFLAPDRELFLRLRWGPGNNQAAPFLVRPAPLGVVSVDVDLEGYGTWDSSKIHSLTLELVDDHLVWIRTLDLWPGPWLELADGPEIVTDPPGAAAVEGDLVIVVQDVRNAGCLLESGTHAAMRAAEVLMTRQSGGRTTEVVCDGAEIPGRIAPDSQVDDLPICAFRLPEAGVWVLETRFVNHASPPAFRTVVVEPAEVPDLAIDLSVPIDLYSGHLDSWPCRSDVLDLSRYGDPDPPCNLPWLVAARVRADGLDGVAESRVRAWARPAAPSGSPGSCNPASAGWLEIAPERMQTIGNGSSVVEIPLARDLVEALPLGPEGWATVDLKVEVEPVSGEQDLQDNMACIASWIVVAAGDVGQTLGPTWVADDYFLDPQHWPPQGLAWTGVTVVHEEGGVSYDPDSALATVTVVDGANEEPRLVWFEERAGESVSGALIRYRRSEPGFGGQPFLDAGAAESDGIPVFELTQPGQPNRHWLVADSQWKTVAWRRGSDGPFGGYPVPVLATPDGAGGTLSWHLAPDENCLLDEPGCPSALYPVTAIDVVAVWRGQGQPPDEPVFAVAGLRMRDGGVWLPPPPEVAWGQAVEFAVGVVNAGTAAGTAVLTAEVDVVAQSDIPSDHTMAGSATVTLEPGEAHMLELAPPWLPSATGGYRVSGPVTESGQWIGSVAISIEVTGGTSPCPVPAIDLP